MLYPTELRAHEDPLSRIVSTFQGRPAGYLLSANSALEEGKAIPAPPSFYLDAFSLSLNAFSSFFTFGSATAAT